MHLVSINTDCQQITKYQISTLKNVTEVKAGVQTCHAYRSPFSTMSFFHRRFRTPLVSKPEVKCVIRRQGRVILSIKGMRRKQKGGWIAKKLPQRATELRIQGAACACVCALLISYLFLDVYLLLHRLLLCFKTIVMLQPSKWVSVTLNKGRKMLQQTKNIITLCISERQFLWYSSWVWWLMVIVIRINVYHLDLQIKSISCNILENLAHQ